jgi:hypothetical protein
MTRDFFFQLNPWGNQLLAESCYIAFSRTHTENITSFIVAFRLTADELCLPQHCIATSLVQLGTARHGKYHFNFLLCNWGNMFTEALPRNALGMNLLSAITSH